MEAATVLRTARQRSALSLRSLAHEAGTSHATLAAYEAGRVIPTVETLERIVRAAGFSMTATLTPAVDDDARRARELRDALELAEQFPRRPRSRHVARLPVFPRS